MPAGRPPGSIGVMETTFPPAGQAGARRGQRDQRSFLLERAQPAMVGLIDGSLSTLAPVFAVAFATRQPHYAFLAGLATAIGAGVSMAFSFAGPVQPAGRSDEPIQNLIILAGNAPSQIIAPTIIRVIIRHGRESTSNLLFCECRVLCEFGELIGVRKHRAGARPDGPVPRAR